MYKTIVFKKISLKIIMGSFVFCLAFPVFAGNFYEQETDSEQPPKAAASAAAQTKPLARLREPWQFKNDVGLLERFLQFQTQYNSRSLKETINGFVTGLEIAQRPLSYRDENPHVRKVQDLARFCGNFGKIECVLKSFSEGGLWRVIALQDIENVTAHPLTVAVNALEEHERGFRVPQGESSRNADAYRTERDAAFQNYQQCLRTIQQYLPAFCTLVESLFAKVTNVIPSQYDDSLGASFKIGIGIRLRAARDPSYQETPWETLFKDSTQWSPKEHRRMLEKGSGDLQRMMEDFRKKRDDLKKERDHLKETLEVMEKERLGGPDFKFTKAGILKSFSLTDNGKHVLSLMNMEWFYLGQAEEYLRELEQVRFSS